MGYKGFSPGLICLDKQYRVGKTFKETNVIPCESGMHFCENPFEVLSHYPLINSEGELNEFARVFSTVKPFYIDGNKYVTSSLYIDKKLTFYDMVYEALQFKLNHERRRDIDRAWQVSSAYAVQIASMSGGAHLIAAGDNSKVFASGKDSQISLCGNQSFLITLGDNSNISIAGECNQIVAEGNDVHIVSSGICTNIHSKANNATIGCVGDGAVISSNGTNCLISASGRNSIVKGRIGDIITLTEWEYKYKLGKYVPKQTLTKIIDGKEIKENKFYKILDGEFVEVERIENEKKNMCISKA
jgi:hypothetical protein